MISIFKIILITLISMMIPINVNAISTDSAIEVIDLTKNSNITLNYNYDNMNLDNTGVKIYFIASITSDLKYQLNVNFLEVGEILEDIKNEDKWDYIKEKLNNYIISNNIEETNYMNIYNNKVIIKDLKPGLYFIKTDKVNNNESYLIFDNILINVPNLSIDGTWNYEIDIVPKIEEKIIINEEDNPNTGDNISIYFYLLILSSLGIVSLIVSFIFKRK